MIDRLRNQVEKEKRDMTILRAVVDGGPLGIVKLADRTDLPEHKVRYSLRMLENDEFVEPTPEGALPVENIGERLQATNDGVDELVARLERIRDDEVEQPAEAEPEAEAE
jgi:Uncharacterized protein conserved in archaea